MSQQDPEDTMVLGHNIFRSTFTISAAQTLARLIGLFTSIFVIRTLLPDDYGLASVAYSFALLIGFFGDFGVGTGTIKYASHYLTLKDPSKVKAIYEFNGFAKLITTLPIWIIAFLFSYSYAAWAIIQGMGTYFRQEVSFY